MRHRGFAAGFAFLAAVLSSETSRAADQDVRPLSFQTLSKAKPHTFSADFYVDNHDRDPWGIDVLDAGFRIRQQLSDHVEVFARIVADRVISMPEAPALPQSPRDLIFLGAARVIPSSFNGEFPYVDRRGTSRFDAFVPGTGMLGFARTWPSDDGLSVGASVALELPMKGTLEALQSGANSGSGNGVFDLLFTHPLAGGVLHGHGSFTLAGKGSRPDRSFEVLGNTVNTIETRTPIGNRIDTGLAWVRPLGENSAVSLESRMTKELVGEERYDAISPVDVLLGLHKAFGRFTLSAALLDHFRPLTSGELRVNPLAGAINLSNVAFLDRNAFLASAGLGAAAGKLREGSHVVAIGVSAKQLPEGATIIPATYNIRSEHNLGYIFNVSFRR